MCARPHGLRLVQDDILLEDKAADILACGAVLYTMLTAQHPGQAQPTSSGAQAPAAAAEAVDSPVDGPLPSLQWPLNSAISSTCKDLLQVMLCTESGARPTVHEILEHPWYMQDLPREIQVHPALALAQTSHRVYRLYAWIKHELLQAWFGWSGAMHDAMVVCRAMQGDWHTVR